MLYEVITDVYVTSIRFNETSFDFGKINEGDTVNHIFNFKNTWNKKRISVLILENKLID